MNNKHKNHKSVELDYNQPLEITKGVYWLGYGYDKAIFQSNPYLLVENDEAVLIDPGSVVDFPIVLKKIKKIISPHKIKYIILHHQDPDLCASVPLFEKELKKEFKIFIPARSSVFCRFYGIKSETVSVNKDYVRLRMSSGRELQFFMTPYVHAPGAMITYDAKNKLVFTSDIFGAFEPDWNLYVKEKDKHLKLVKAFMEPYMGCKPALMNVAKKLQQLDIELICPQHGSIIDSDIKWWIKQLTKMRTGLALREEVKWW